MRTARVSLLPQDGITEFWIDGPNDLQISKMVPTDLTLAAAIEMALQHLTRMPSELEPSQQETTPADSSSGRAAPASPDGLRDDGRTPRIHERHMSPADPGLWKRDPIPPAAKHRHGLSVQHEQVRVMLEEHAKKRAGYCDSKQADPGSPICAASQIAPPTDHKQMVAVAQQEDSAPPSLMCMEELEKPSPSGPSTDVKDATAQMVPKEQQTAVRTSMPELDPPAIARPSSGNRDLLDYSFQLMLLERQVKQKQHMEKLKAIQTPAEANDSPCDQERSPAVQQQGNESTSGCCQSMDVTSGPVSWDQSGRHALQDYQMRLMLLERHNKQKLLQERRNKTSETTSATQKEDQAPSARSEQQGQRNPPSQAHTGGPLDDVDKRLAHDGLIQSAAVEQRDQERSLLPREQPTLRPKLVDQEKQAKPPPPVSCLRDRSSNAAHRLTLRQPQLLFKRHKNAEPYPAPAQGVFALQDREMQLMLLEQQKKKRLLMARHDPHVHANQDTQGQPPVHGPNEAEPQSSRPTVDAAQREDGEHKSGVTGKESGEHERSLTQQAHTKQAMQQRAMLAQQRAMLAQHQQRQQLHGQYQYYQEQLGAQKATLAAPPCSSPVDQSLPLSTQTHPSHQARTMAATQQKAQALRAQMKHQQAQAQAQLPVQLPAHLRAQLTDQEITLKQQHATLLQRHAMQRQHMLQAQARAQAIQAQSQQYEMFLHQERMREAAEAALPQPTEEARATSTQEAPIVHGRTRQLPLRQRSSDQEQRLERPQPSPGNDEVKKEDEAKEDQQEDSSAPKIQVDAKPSVQHNPTISSSPSDDEWEVEAFNEPDVLHDFDFDSFLDSDDGDHDDKRK